MYFTVGSRRLKASKQISCNSGFFNPIHSLSELRVHAYINRDARSCSMVARAFIVVCDTAYEKCAFAALGPFYSHSLSDACCSSQFSQWCKEERFVTSPLGTLLPPPPRETRKTRKAHLTASQDCLRAVIGSHAF